MSGVDFELFLKLLLARHGYTTKLTKRSHDFGADILASRNGETIVVQAKRSTSTVGVSAIAEARTAQEFYKTGSAWVITNNYFTKPARQLAQGCGTKLFEREDLIALMDYRLNS